MYNNIIEEMDFYKNEVLAKHHLKFFKTGKGEYGEGDLFLGLTVPQVRSIVKKYYKDINLDDCKNLLRNKYHEIRLCGLLIMVAKYKKADEKLKQKIVELYLKNTKYINNWDLVDLSASYIIGDYYLEKEKDVIYNLANSKFLWNERISIISTHRFIKEGKFNTTLDLCENFLQHKH